MARMNWMGGARADAPQYDAAQICLNGHVINDAAKNRPHYNATHCEKCGAETITACPACRADIRGKMFYGPALNPGPALKGAPAFCYGCGKPYPWTADKIAAARLMVDESELSQDDKEQLKASFDDLVRDTPRTELAATRFKRLAAKAGRGTADALKELLIQVASETAKKLITGQ